MARPAKSKRSTSTDGIVTVAGKGSNGTGSIYFDRSKGVYRAAWVDAGGHRRRVSGATKEEAARRMAEAREVARRRPGAVAVGPGGSVAELARLWLSEVADSGRVRPSTVGAYAKCVSYIAADPVGGLRVADLDAEAVAAFIQRLRATYSVATVRNIRTALRQVVDVAVDVGFLSANPVSKVRPPKASAEQRRAKRTLSPAQVVDVIEGLDGSGPLDAAISLLLTNGLRASEVLGLAWEDLDLERATAQVARASTYAGAGIGQRLDRPKTERTAGVVHLHPRSVELLRARKEKQEDDRLGADPAWRTTIYEGRPIELVFTAKDGRPALRAALHKAMRAACERAGLDATGIGTHAGRRSVVTNLFKAGVPIDDIARHVGHKSTTTTAGYVADLGTRPAEVAKRAWELFDRHDQGEAGG